MTTELIALIAALYGFCVGVGCALGWKLTAGPESHTEHTEPQYEFHDFLSIKGSNFDYLCEWPIDDVRPDWWADRLQRMGEG